MEVDIRKQGMLYLLQQRFGKKWKRVWCILYRESSCSISRLEFFEYKDGGSVEKIDKNLRKQQEHKKVIRLADCIRVSEVEMDGCPKDTGPFLIETTEKIYMFAADKQQLDDWTHKLCEIAFPMSWMEHSVRRGSLQRGNRVDEDEGMEDNSLYSGRETVRDFRVCVRRTEASDRCRLKGDGVLRADVDALHLIDKTGDVVCTWPYRYLRRFGRDKAADDVYSMLNETPNLPMIHHKDKETSTPSQHQQQQHRPPLTRLEPPVDKTLTGVKSLTLDTRGIPIPRKNQVKMISSCPLPHAGPEHGPNSAPGPGSTPTLNPRLSPKLSSNPEQTYSQISLPTAAERSAKREKRGGGVAPPCTPPLIPQEPEYSLPFDTITINVMSDTLASHQSHAAEAGADPLYDSIDEMKIRNLFLSDADTLGPSYRKVEHIYDEPEGCAAAAETPATSVYDDPEEMRGDAWRIMGTAADPKGHEYPYNPRVDDYAVPKRPQRVFPVRQSTKEEEEDEEEEPKEEEEQSKQQQDSTYKNVMVKMA
ncbi:docking protein 2 isoform X2 [Siniperca chuatsi]|uniref:docking protein 2 isoform X2 n=1 Tax=Siniperca chuatsi TaxID=119488 RepID=UPI001CE11BE6|nr:docking protein 2 isoform X2 [Siniperca chuatsi]